MFVPHEKEAPPFVVLQILDTPPMPPANPVCASRKCRQLGVRVNGVVNVQFNPPFVVLPSAFVPST